MEIPENTSWLLLMGIALVLGLRHGLDLDHLATIDAIARASKEKPMLSRFTGFLFSLGHGLVVTAVSLIIGAGVIEAQAPEWLKGVGKGISIFFLSLFGLLNLWTVFQKKSASQTPAGIQSFLVKKMAKKEFNASMIILVGALFAISFDTISQIGLFSIAATTASGWLFAGLLGVLFTFGMMITDSLNGLFVSTLVLRADKKSQIISRSLGIAIALFSLTIAFLGLLDIFTW